MKKDIQKFIPFHQEGQDLLFHLFRIDNLNPFDQGRNQRNWFSVLIQILSVESEYSKKVSSQKEKFTKRTDTRGAINGMKKVLGRWRAHAIPIQQNLARSKAFVTEWMSQMKELK